MDSDIVYEIKSLEASIPDPNDTTKTVSLTSYMNVWGYQGDPYDA